MSESSNYLKYSKILKAISDPTRRNILECIAKEPLNPEELARNLVISRPGIEKHLKILCQFGLASREVDLFSAKLIYTTTDHAISLMKSIDQALKEYELAATLNLKIKLDQYEKDYLLGRIGKDNWLKLKKELEEQLEQSEQSDQDEE
ncbi:MAG: ArsR/SmtB family transcription factor [Candidatus Odinarchaeota archaeon]